jgi:hypothetical protein
MRKVSLKAELLTQRMEMEMKSLLPRVQAVARAEENVPEISPLVNYARRMGTIISDSNVMHASHI